MFPVDLWFHCKYKLSVFVCKMLFTGTTREHSQCNTPRTFVFQELKLGMELEDETGKGVPALTVFSLSIKFLKDHLLETLGKQATGVRADDIQWVLTVPAIWSDAAKIFMREAALRVTH
jgi:hypothetical protein